MTFSWAAGEQRSGGLITRSWCDPCPVCGEGVAQVEGETTTVRDNPDALISVRNPACPYDGEDPDSPECICTTIPNPCPDPLLDRVITVGVEYQARPCGHGWMESRPVLPGRQPFRFYQQTVPVPGTLGALMADWTAAEGQSGE